MTISARPAADDPATLYALAVMDGNVTAGEYVRAACQRHLQDLEHGSARGLDYRPDVAKRKCGFFPAVLTVTEGSAAGKPFHLLPWHEFVVGSLYGWHRSDGLRRFRMAWMETGKGQAKALALDTPIPTPGGWTTMGALTDGDVVLDDSGRPCRILRAHPVVTGQDCYRVRFDDGAEIIANAGHLWRTEMRNSGNSGHGDATKGVPRAQRGGWRNGIRTTAEIAATLTYKNGKYRSANHSVALAGAVDLPEVALPVHPYVLGAWLGDGDSDCARITCGDQDASAMTEIMAGCGIILSRQNGHACRYGLRSGDRWGLRAENLSNRLRSLGLYGNKHIPAAYMRASRDQRLALLQGLMDTDGTIGADGQCCFGVVNRGIAEGALEIAISLGLKVTLGTERARLYGADCGEVYRVRFYAPEALPVFRLPRKLVRQKALHARRRLSGERRIVACERVESVPVRCITVDSPSSMFLAGRQMVPTHNSPIMAGIGLEKMGFDGKDRSEVYAIAGDKDQANVLFKDAVAMCRATIPEHDDGDSLEARGIVRIRGTGDNAWKVEHPGSQSKFQSMASVDSISGPRPYAVLADEIHEFKTAYALQIWKAAIDKMSGDPIMILGTNTPASNQIVGTEYSELFQKVVTGQADDDTLFGFIARVDRADQETVFDNEECWAKALPALGVTYPIENVRQRVNTAKLMLSEALATKRLYFGIPVGTDGFWISEEAWSRCQGVVDEAAMVDAPCFLGLDLSKKNDLTALTAAWRKDLNLYVKTWYFTTKAGIHDRSRDDNAPYDKWAADKLIEAVPGATIDYEFVAAKVQALSAAHKVEMMAFDPAKIDDFIDACGRIEFPVWKFEGADKPAGKGLKLVTHGQGTRVLFTEKSLCMPRSIEKMEDGILDGSIVIDESPVTKMCAANCVVVADAMNNRAFDKKRSRGRIDGMVSIAEAVGAADAEFEEAAAPSVMWL